LSKKSRTLLSDSLVYVFVNIRRIKEGESVEYFVVPSRIVAQKIESYVQGPKQNEWHTISRRHVEEFRDRWDIFTTGTPATVDSESWPSGSRTGTS
jgi:hypothetical protein